MADKDFIFIRRTGGGDVYEPVWPLFDVESTRENRSQFHGDLPPFPS
jgi:hypothetical protein